MSKYQNANLAKSVWGFILTLLNGLLDSSVFVFLLLKKGFDSGFNLYSIFQILTCFTLLLQIRTYFFLPKKKKNSIFVAFRKHGIWVA